MQPRMKTIATLFGVGMLIVSVAACQKKQTHTTTAGGTEVKLCDNHTTTTLPDGTVHNRESGQRVADALMDQWTRQHPDRSWEKSVRTSHPRIPTPADNSSVLSGQQAAGQTYGNYTKKDVLTWSRETEKAVLEGARVFHDGGELGSTISVSCDMCHPDAANTHPETYPKYQVQMGRVVLLRDMINWCLEHPVRAQPMQADDPRMRAMEAYIYAQRKGSKLDFGKH